MTPPIDRRSFLLAAGATMAAGGLAPTLARGDAPAKGGWKKAFMLGTSSGAIRPDFLRLKEAGFDGVELISPNKLDRDEVLKARDETGLIIHGVSGSEHWKSPLSSPDLAVVKKGMDAIRASIADCKAYSGTTVLLVPGVVGPNVSHRQVEERSSKAIRELLPEAEAAGIKIAIEEVWNKFLLSAPAFVEYVDSFKSPALGAYFDVGNVVEYGYPQEWIRELGQRTLKVHIKEYGKQKRFSYPLGEGEIDWPAVRQALIDVGYNGWITAEVGYGDLDKMKDVVARMDKILGPA
ncbi:sugar phosphate isomerase/epimerase family protein [Tundrisphaera sp. TA3]|uniref:sugar phosphate isomerase/epimerase family protein n=1 Tax=Tundrisphaera sp. TA3 TaxID=3435775 RepID=UPI003EBB236C